MGRLPLYCVLALAVCGCKWGESNKLPTPKITRLPNSSDTATYRGMDAFAFRLLGALDPGHGNVVCSPVAVEQFLGVVLNASSGPAREELFEQIGTNENDREAFNESQRALLNSLRQDGRPFKVANAVYTVWPVLLHKGFVQEMGESYDAGVKKLGSAGIGSVTVANQWIEANTDGTVHGVFKDFSVDEKLVGASVARFSIEGMSDGGKVDGVPMAVYSGEMALTEDGSVIEVPLQNGFTLVLVRGTDLEGALKTRATKKQGSVRFPVLALSQTTEIQEGIKALGVTSLFNDQCNLRHMAIEMESGYPFSRIVHRVEIEMSLSQAKAAGGAETITLPFSFAVRHDSTGVLCLAGVVRSVPTGP